MVDQWMKFLTKWLCKSSDPVLHENIFSYYLRSIWCRIEISCLFRTRINFSYSNGSNTVLKRQKLGEVYRRKTFLGIELNGGKRFFVFRSNTNFPMGITESRSENFSIYKSRGSYNILKVSTRWLTITKFLKNLAFSDRTETM